MALSGLEIYKHLPKTNCKDCGFPTCLAFAMKMAAKQVSLEKCPHVTEAGKAALESAARPPIQLVTIGADGQELRTGNETQLYRHEEKFHRPTLVAVRVSDALDEAAAAARLEAIGKLSFERVGEPNLLDKIATEEDARTEEEVLAHLEKVGHPAMSLAPLM